MAGTHLVAKSLDERTSSCDDSGPPHTTSLQPAPGHPFVSQTPGGQQRMRTRTAGSSTSTRLHCRSKPKSDAYLERNLPPEAGGEDNQIDSKPLDERNVGGTTAWMMIGLENAGNCLMFFVFSSSGAWRAMECGKMRGDTTPSAPRIYERWYKFTDPGSVMLPRERELMENTRRLQRARSRRPASTPD